MIENKEQIKQLHTKCQKCTFITPKSNTFRVLTDGSYKMVCVGCFNQVTKGNTRLAQ